MILEVAIRNTIGNTFYGLIFNASTFFKTAKLFPEGGGYAGLFHGKVVDMLYFPIITGSWPQWFPVWGGQQFIFFRPVFNIADSSITIGVFIMIIFQRTFFSDRTKEVHQYPETFSNHTSDPQTENSTPQNKYP